MKNNVLTIYYNSPAVTAAQGVCLLAGEYHVADKTLTPALLVKLLPQLPEDAAFIVTDAQVVHPPFWQKRIGQAADLPEHVTVCSALSTEYFELSPLTAEQKFKGGVQALDQLLYLRLTPSYFPTSELNTACFWVRDKHALSQIFAETTGRHALNNCLVQAEAVELCLQEARDYGDQRPLPSHPLALFHVEVDCESSFEASEAYPLLDDKPVVLHINMDWGGGVHKWINDYIDCYPAYHHFVLSSCGELYRQQHGEQYQLLWQGTNGTEVARFQMNRPIRATKVSDAEYQNILDQLIKRWQVNGLVVSTLIGHAMDCLDTGLPTLRVLHDYFPHWPLLNAQLDANEIDEKMCFQALKQTEREPFGLISELEWKAWQQAENRLIKQDHVVLAAPSKSVKENILKLNESDGFEKTIILPHGIKTIKPIEYAVEAEPFTVLVLGRINPPKGQGLLDACLLHFEGRDDIKFVFIGAGNEGKKYLPNPMVSVVMDYEANELPKLLQKASPQLALITSLASETFNYTLSELQSAAVPVLSTMNGSLKARITEGETGFLSDDSSPAFVAKIDELMKDRSKLQHVHKQLKSLKPLNLNSAMQAYNTVFKVKVSQRDSIPRALNQPHIWSQRLQAKVQQTKVMEAQLLSLEQDVADKVAWASSLSEQIKHLEHNIQLSRAEEKYLKSEIEAHKLDIKVKENQNKELLKQNTGISEQLSKSQVAVDKLNQELSAVYQSRSWQVTRPMRRFTTWARHKRNAIKFRGKQIKSWPKRGINSFKTRGLSATIKIIIGKFKKTKKPSLSVKAKQPSKVYKPFKLKLPEAPQVSVIVPVYNHFEHTYHCLKSLQQLADKTTFEVIVVDDCSTDETEKLIKKISGIRYQRQSENGGFIESCNTGAKMAKGEFLLFLNNDTEVHTNGVDALVQTFVDKPDAGLVGSQLIYPDGRLQESGGIVFSDASGWNYGRLDDVNKPCYQHLREVSYCSGASILIRAALFEQLGCFDERYKPAYYEDTDLAFAVRDAGLKVYVQPASRVTHFEGISSGTDLTSGMKKYQVINQDKFLDKWQDALQKQPASGSDIELARFQNQPKRVLIFDACTPTPDQDSGSLRMLNLMKIFQQLGYQVSFIPENMAHFENYTASLQHIGIECIYGPTFSNPVDYLSQMGRYFDVVLLSRYYVAAPVMGMIRDYCPNAQLLFDTVDLHYLREQRMAEVSGDKKQLAAAADTKEKELAVAKRCDSTLVVSPYEQTVLAEEVPALDVQILSNIHEVYGCLKPFGARKDLVFIGGYQHTPNVDGILWFIDAIWPNIKAAIPEIQLHIVGSKAPQEVEDLGKMPGVVFHGFVEDIEPVMSDYRIAVAPLRFGAGVKGKVNMSMSYGQPVVGTAVAVEGMYTRHGVDVMMSDDAQIFAEHVIKLYQDEALWNQVSKGGLANVEQWFSFNAAKEQIQNIIK
ncbi:glycosyltransferase [Marinicella rhabdoformis]|uniref:glycosyltransferase n=1 Tax=Marinicella rhabdoformis TaxID=2580566 RepID=UPI0012AED64C|nr:glycosyltransferase [Marinicella rhabdoformis]